MIANLAHITTPEPARLSRERKILHGERSINGGIHKTVDGVLGIGFVPKPGHLLNAVEITTEDERNGGRPDKGRAGQLRQFSFFLGISEPDDRILL